MIEIRNLRKTYFGKMQDVVAIDDISFKLPSRGLVALYGENGCGKTTLLNALGTVDMNYEGDILYNDVNYREMIPELRRNVISFVFQENQFVNYLDVGENIELFAEEESQILESCKEFGIEDKVFSIPSNLSGGQKQRAAVIRGLLKQYAVLLVDEPTSSMNEQMEAEVFQKLCEIAKEKLVVLVSHNMTLIHKYSDFIIHMDSGCIVSIEENRGGEIKYEDDTIIVPENFYNISKVDLLFVKKLLEENRTIKIKTGVASESAENERKIDFDTPIKTEKKEAKRLSKTLGKSIHKYSFFNSKSDIFLGFLLTLVCLVALNLAVWLMFYNKYETQFYCFNRSLSGGVFYKTTHYYDEHNLTYKDLQIMREKYDSKILQIFGNEEYMPLDTITGEYTKACANGFILFKDGEIKLKHGRMPNADEVLISDYLADVVLESGCAGYSSMDDILEKGFISLDRKIKVSGIVATGYDTIGTDPIRSAEIENRKENEWACVYYPYEQYMNGDTIYYARLTDLKTFAEIRPLDKTKITLDRKIIFSESDYNKLCRVGRISYGNKWLSENFSYLNTFVENSSIVIMGEVDSAEDYPVFYVEKEVLDIIKENISEYSERFYIYPKSSEELRYLGQFAAFHRTYVSDTLKNIDDFVQALRNSIVYVVVIILVLLLIITSIMFKKIAKSDCKLIAFEKMAGYDKKAYFGFEAIKIAIIYAQLLIVSVILTVLLGVGINALVETVKNVPVNLFTGNIAPIFLAYLGLLLIYLLVGCIICKRIDKEEIISLLKK